MNFDMKPIVDPIKQASEQKPDDKQQTGDDKQANDDNSWKGRYDALMADKEKLEAAAANATFLAPKVLELQERLKATETRAQELDSEEFKKFKATKEQEPETEFFTPEDKERLIDIHGEDGAKLFMEHFERMQKSFQKKLQSVPQGESKETKQQLASVIESTENAKFLGLFESTVRQKIINPNSELMKFAASQKVGRKSSMQDEINEILKSKDSSPEALAYVSNVIALHEASKKKPTVDAPNGRSQTQTTAAGSSGTPPVMKGVPRFQWQTNG